MDEKEIAEIMNMPFSKLFALCHDDRDILRAMISLAIKNGILKGKYQTCLSYNKMLREHNEVFSGN